VFAPQVGGSIAIGTKTYYFAEHPAFPSVGFVHGQEGRAGTVYRLTDTTGTDWALKVFDEAYQLEPPSSLLEKMAQLATLPGLSVCQRTILTPAEHNQLLQQSPDLQHAVLMPWIKGTTWASTVDSKKLLKHKESLALANVLLDILVRLEQSGIAHSDLSSSNIITTSGNKPSLELVDVEQLYAPGLEAPHTLLGSSPGYAHTKSAAGLWQPEADRFAGAVLLAEILGWCDKRICAAADGGIAQSYFRPGEEQTDCERYRLLHDVLQEQWGQPVADLFQKTWRAEELSQCPTFAEWKSAITCAEWKFLATNIRSAEPVTHPVTEAPVPTNRSAAEVLLKTDFGGLPGTMLILTGIASIVLALFLEVSLFPNEMDGLLRTEFTLIGKDFEVDLFPWEFRSPISAAELDICFNKECWSPEESVLPGYLLITGLAIFILGSYLTRSPGVFYLANLVLILLLLPLVAFLLNGFNYHSLAYHDPDSLVRFQQEGQESWVSNFFGLLFLVSILQGFAWYANERWLNE